MRLLHHTPGAVVAILIAATALVGAPAQAAAPAHPTALGLQAASARDGFCTAGDTTAVTVVVDFGSLGGGTLVRCASGLSRGANGVQALAAAGISLTGTNRYGSAFVCRLDGRPAADEPLTAKGDPNYLEQCADTPSSDATWSYWGSSDGGGWSYLTEGVSTHRVTLGGFEGWSFAAGDGTPPGVSPSLPAAPAPAPAPEPAPAVATPTPAPAPAPVAPATDPAAGSSGGSGGGGSGTGTTGSGSTAAAAPAAPAATAEPTAADPVATEPPSESAGPVTTAPPTDDSASAQTTTAPPTSGSTTDTTTTTTAPSPSPASSPVTTAPSAVTTGVDATAAAAPSGSSAIGWTLGGIALLAALAGGGFVLARRRRVED